jgi:hypothetical protein
MSFTTTKTEDYVVEIPFKRLLEKHNLFNVVKEGIILKLRSIPEIQKLKMNPELTGLVCNIIENSIVSNGKKHKLDKMQLATEILTHIFNLNIVEIEYIKTQIEYLVTNGKIKAIPILKKVLNATGAWLSRKLL